MLPQFEYVRPRTFQEALDCLRLAGEKGLAFAGGTDLLVKIRSGRVKPGLVVSIGLIPELSFIRKEDNGLRLGAGVTHAMIAADPMILACFPALAEAAGSVGTPQIRNKGTIGGNLANSSPAADTAVVTIALDGIITVCGAEGGREIQAEKFFCGPGINMLRPGELIASIFFPGHGWTGMGFAKLGKRNGHAISVVNSAAAAVVENDVIKRIWVAVGAVAPLPVRAKSVENALQGKTVSHQLIAEASTLIAEDIQPISDIRASAAYRRKVAGVLVARSLKKAFGLGGD